MRAALTSSSGVAIQRPNLRRRRRNRTPPHATTTKAGTVPKANPAIANAPSRAEPLPPAIEVAVLRIGRESVWNAVQHAAPTSIAVTLIKYAAALLKV